MRDPKVVETLCNRVGNLGACRRYTHVHVQEMRNSCIIGDLLRPLIIITLLHEKHYLGSFSFIHSFIHCLLVQRCAFSRSVKRWKESERRIHEFVLILPRYKIYLG